MVLSEEVKVDVKVGVYLVSPVLVVCWKQLGNEIICMDAFRCGVVPGDGRMRNALDLPSST